MLGSITDWPQMVKIITPNDKLLIFLSFYTLQAQIHLKGVCGAILYAAILLL